MQRNRGIQFLAIFLLQFVLIDQSHAVSLIANVPNAEVTEKNSTTLAHESQFAIENSKKPWNSLSFLTYGVADHWELASSLYNVTNPASQRIAISLGFKTVQEISHTFGLLHEIRYYAGSEIPVALQGSGSMGVWAFAGISFRFAPTRTRFTAGPSYGTHQIFGRDVLTAMLGLEQPLVHRLAFVSDWVSGVHDLGALILALQYDPTPRYTIITGPKISNDSTSSGNAWMIEITAKL